METNSIISRARTALAAFNVVFARANFGCVARALGGGGCTLGATILGRPTRWVVLTLAAATAVDPVRAAVLVNADVSVHIQYVGATGAQPVFRVTNNSTAGETIGSVRLTPPGSAWLITTCLPGPVGWTTTLVLGSCVFRSVAGRQDDIPVSGSATFRATVDVRPGSTNASGVWDVRLATDENVTADSPLASGGEGSLAASVWVWEVVNTVVSTAQVSPGVVCPPAARQAPSGATRTIVLCGRNHANMALTPQAAASSLGGSFIASSGTFSSQAIAAGFSGVLATWSGATVTSIPGSAHTVQASIGSSGNATSPSTQLGGYNATPPIAAPTLTGTQPASPANANALRVRGRATPFTTVRLYTDAACSVGPVATATAADFELNGFAVSALDNSSTTFRATATDGFGTVSPCSSGLTYIEDSAAPAFAGLRTATPRSGTTIRLAWQAAGDTVSPESDIVYDVCRTTVSGGCSSFTQNYMTAPGAQSFDVPGLTPDTRSFFVVRARDKAGNQDTNAVQVSGRSLGIKPNVSVSAGGAHACALHSDGGVVCWGSNNSGEVGRGTLSPTSEPILVLRGAVAVSASIGSFTCAVMSSGRVRCWGLNDHGQLGDGTTVSKDSPTEVLGISTAVAVSAGGAHACALLANGRVKCWGYNSKGELGDGTTTDRSTSVSVSGLNGVKAIAAGTQHTCAVLHNGRVQCWGLNQYGEVGDSTNNDRHTPVFVSAMDSVTALAAGHWHTCALRATGEVYCWGRGDMGQLGNGDTADQNAPVRVDMPADVASIAAGGAWNSGWSCAVTASGLARCWGDNFLGNFGNGSIALGGVSTPVTVTNLPDVATVSTGSGFGCFVLAHGSLFCSGRNDSGQLVDSTISLTATPVSVSLTRASMGVQVSSGLRHTCAIVADGTVRCWGHNGSGRLGNGTTTQSSIPVEVAGVPGARSVSAGGAFTCALDAFGRVWCFGDNSFQQLGNGGWRAGSSPVEVAGLPEAIAITAGHSHACALLLDGWAACWGDESYGQVGPAGSGGQFGFTTGAVAIAADLDHTCALLADGTVNCWGANASGQLGDNTTSQSSQPVAVSGITDATAIAVGGSHTCAQLADATVQCWGANAAGQLGGGNTQPSAGKVVVRTLGATGLDAGLDHTCAMVVDGTVRCWGAGADGRLGNGSTSNQSTRVQVTPFP